MARSNENLNLEIKKELKPLLLEKGLNNCRVVLFGSYATHTNTADSDIDLILISPIFRDKSIFERVELTTGIGRSLVKTFKKPFDLLFYSDQEWAHSSSPVIAAAKKEGKILCR